MSFSVAKRVSIADRSLSNSARCASVKNSWFAYLAGRCRAVSNSSVQMPWRSGSPQGVVSGGAGAGAGALTEAAGAWADVGVTDTETAAPTAVAAMASVIVEPEKRSSMMASFCLGVGDCIGLGSRCTIAVALSFVARLILKRDIWKWLSLFA